MKILTYCNHLSLGGTEKAACIWAGELKRRGHEVVFATFHDGPRRDDLERASVPLFVLEKETGQICRFVQAVDPEVVHIHAPGNLNPLGDIFGRALLALDSRPPVIQTNVFGRLENSAENQWVDFRMFVSWTSCTQAARRAGVPLDETFFRKSSVAVYPLHECPPVAPADCARLKTEWDIKPDEVVFGRISRPDPAKWLDLPVKAFRKALKKNKRIKLLLREPPTAVADDIRHSADADRFVILPATHDYQELLRTYGVIDVILHASSIGESFGYGLAEPMSVGKPSIANSTPWADQAQIELVRPGQYGFIASTPAAMAKKILWFAENKEKRVQMGAQGARHIQRLTDLDASVDRLEKCIQALLDRSGNPFVDSDLAQGLETDAYVRRHEWGSDLGEMIHLRTKALRIKIRR